MKTYTSEQLQEILVKHLLYLQGKEGGECANLRSTNLSGADLRGSDLRSVHLRGSDLRDANLRSANLSNTNLSNVNLSGADLRRANLRSANLRGSDLRDANLSTTNLRRANLNSAYLSGTILPNFQICPEEGSFIAWKKVSDSEGLEYVVKLKILGDRTSSLIGRKCRTNRAKILTVYDISGEEVDVEAEYLLSNHDCEFKWWLDKDTVEPDYDPDIRVECTTGLHFFMTWDEAKKW